jgi:NADH-quinone oxidoreductase subunit F
LIEGPDDYLLGVETAMLEVIQGNDPLPRLVPPYIQGVIGPDGTEYATIVNNVETLANVPQIVSQGAEWFRSAGTERSPGTMVFTISGHVMTPGVAELPLGTPLSFLIYGPGGGMKSKHGPKLIVSGASNRPLTAGEIDTPMSFEAMEAIDSGLGSGGFIVYDETTCAVEVGAVFSSFLARASCGQCPPCKLGTTEFANGFRRILDGRSSRDEVDVFTAWISRVTDANRCGLGAGQREVARGILYTFADDVIACLEGRCPGHRGLTI